MKRTSSALSNLLLLQEIEAREGNQALRPSLREDVLNRIRAIRTLLPNPLLIHHDRMREQGRLSLVPIRDGCCQACHMQVSQEAVRDLQCGYELMLCEICGVYVYRPLPEEK
jgi:predicted  nucleic acid-binding Zn-ribbon protein